MATNTDVLVLTPQQWDYLVRALIAPPQAAPSEMEIQESGLIDQGVFSGDSPAPEILPTVEGIVSSQMRIELRNVDLQDDVPIRNVTFWVGPTSTTIVRPLPDGIHVYGCQAEELPQILLHHLPLQPKPYVDDAPQVMPMTILEGASNGEVEGIERGVKELQFVTDPHSAFGEFMEHNLWRLSLAHIELLGSQGWELAAQLYLFSVPTCLYSCEQSPTSEDEVLLKKVANSEVWAGISSCLFESLRPRLAHS